ncbi:MULTISPECIES: alpha/beta hydrolase [Enterococcus]|uniref:alpha/beta hydrolase n=1 Tax=Enterococcus TaxID=1350 RepID=UPI001484CF44|nr:MULTISPECIES: alpha/beta hydrolase-fold protein [Enterococcus]MBE9886679.1 hypothetical protein [Enterococcus durans]MDB1678845.1 alpha/beta hydrolase-fold protein [Enterococcus durans]
MVITGTYASVVLRRPNHYTAVLPNKLNAATKAIFLLHGFGFDEQSWLHNTPLVQYSEKYNVAFFSPDAGISFYTDHIDGQNYGEAIGKEFYEEMQRVFNLDMTRENTAIAGFSMGGYGSVLLGLRFSQFYGWIGGFSPAFVFYKKERNEAHFNHVFSKGDYGSENDVLVRYQELLESDSPIPSIIFTCGVEDPLCQQTENIIQQLKEIDPKARIEFKTQSGFHDFSLWKNDLSMFLEKFAK